MRYRSDRICPGEKRGLLAPDELPSRSSSSMKNSGRDYERVITLSRTSREKHPDSVCFSRCAVKFAVPAGESPALAKVVAAG